MPIRAGPERVKCILACDGSFWLACGLGSPRGVRAQPVALGAARDVSRERSWAGVRRQGRGDLRGVFGAADVGDLSVAEIPVVVRVHRDVLSGDGDGDGDA